MEDIICLSSGSDDDSDLEVISSYNEEKEDAIPFIRAQWLQVTPVLINITGHNFTPPRRRFSRRDTCSSPEVIDLSEDDPPADVSVQKPSPTHKKVHVTPTSFGKPQVSQSQTSVGKDVANSRSFVGSTVQSVACKPLGQENTLADMLQRTEDYLHQDTNCNSSLPSEQLSWDKSLEHYRSNDESKNPFKYESEVLKNTKDTQLNTPAVCGTEADQEDSLDSSQKWEDRILSPYNLDSPYYCPSEVDAYIFSDSSNKSEDNDHPYTTYDSQQSTSELPSATHTASVSNALSLKEESEAMNIFNNEDLRVHPKTSSPSIPTSSMASPPWSPELSSRPSKPNSPTSTEILASDTAAHSPDLFTLSSASSPLSLISQPSSPNFPEKTEKNRSDLDAGSLESPPIRLWETSSDGDNENVLDNVESELSENNSEDRQHICLTQYKKLSQCMSGIAPQMDDDEEDEHYGSAEPLCRQSLSLVYSTIEENYPEGTLQLLSDFIQPRYYPPVDITTHLLRGILLNPQSPDVFIVEAYNLLMKTQRYHPVNASTVPWDWEVMKSVMEEQDDTKRLRPEVQHMFLQYALQVLEDDFHLGTVTKRILGGGQFKDIISWLTNAAKESVRHSKDVEYPKKEDNYLKIVLSLQRMLTLALEVNKDLTYSSEKFALELYPKMHSCRQTRLLLLRTLDSKLLRCQLLKLLLDDCSENTDLTISLNLLLHYLKSSTLASESIDEAEKWRKWDELLQLLWMLMLSFEEVVTDHLHRPITNRHALIWTQNPVTRSEVQEATHAFLTRAADDIGHPLPVEMQDLLSQLQEHINDISSVISSR
ncbi:hypothetical protein QQF64_007096 [Cirrhinus molitorella]|uniref:Uncharacterized protein n=2 Tax=Cirrhinus molitorella TaxID=172907 RepID=A0ABR3M9Q6_9TELE|nr:hypothetical protein Q8A67_013602 [Cirrhinus molitorella]